MPIRSDLNRLGPFELVEMFEFDPRNIGASSSFVLRWHPGTTAGHNPITWQGVVYQPYPVETTGFEQRATGKLPRPTLRASNVAGQLGAFMAQLPNDALGAKITRKRTIGKYLDAVNFPDGNPHADPDAGMPDEMWFLARKMSENPIFMEYELAVPFDVEGIKLPRRQVIAGTCQWIYRGTECAYTGPPVQDINGNPTTDPDADACRKTLTACRARFGTGVLRTSAFPSSLLARYG